MGYRSPEKAVEELKSPSVVISLDKELLKKLRHLAIEKDRSVKEIVQAVVTAWINKQEV